MTRDIFVNLHAGREPCEIQWAGEKLHLLPERALWWSGGRTLFIADIHLGKAATYRALGQPVPSGTTRENLARLTALMMHYEPLQVVFLISCTHSRHVRLRCFLHCKPGATGLQVLPVCWCAATTTAVRVTHRLRSESPSSTSPGCWALSQHAIIRKRMRRTMSLLVICTPRSIFMGVAVITCVCPALLLRIARSYSRRLANLPVAGRCHGQTICSSIPSAATKSGAFPERGASVAGRKIDLKMQGVARTKAHEVFKKAFCRAFKHPCL